MKERVMVPIYVPKTTLDKINNLRIQYPKHREAQYKFIDRLLKFYEEHNANT